MPHRDNHGCVKTASVLSLFAILSVVAITLLAILSVRQNRPTDSPAGDTGGNKTPRSATVRFELWELHSDDTVRIADVIEQPSGASPKVAVSLPMLRPGDDILSLEFVGGKQTKETKGEAEYGGAKYQTLQYVLQASGNEYGYIARIVHPPHLHINGGERLISIGTDPSGRKQAVIAVAIPGEAHIKQVADYQPYKTVEQGPWRVYYYDVTQIQSHVSIHIGYIPRGDAPFLDWSAVKAGR